MLHISRLVFVQHKNKKRMIIMEKLNYMDIKKIADFTITKIAVEILREYSDESITEYLEKYECQSVKELIYLLLCETKPSDLNISLNMRQKIKNISEEVTQSESEDEELNSNISKVLNDKDELAEKLELMKTEQSELLKKVQEIIQINKTLTMKLQKKNQSDLGL
jgi:hypothetical protein